MMKYRYLLHRILHAKVPISRKLPFACCHNASTRDASTTTDNQASHRGDKHSAFSGICAAPLTPFKNNGDLDIDKIPSYAKHLEDFKVSGVFVTGTISEGNSLTVVERKQIMKLWVEMARNRFFTILHIGTGNLRDSQELAAYAEEIGADGIACVTPTYYKPRNEDDYVEYMKHVASAAPSTPFFLYDIDFVTGLYLNLARFFEIGKERIPTLYGIKHTSPSIVSMNQIDMMEGGRFHVMPGGDETYLSTLAIGLSSPVVASYSGPTLLRIKAAFDRNDMDTARMEQNRLSEFARIRGKYPYSFVSVTKAIMQTMGVDLGPPRLPITPLPQSATEKLQDDLNEIGFYEWVKE